MRHGGFFGNADVAGAQAEAVRVPLANGTLFVLPVGENPALIPSLLTLSDVMGTGHHAALHANVGPGKKVAVVGDGAVGRVGVPQHELLPASQPAFFNNVSVSGGPAPVRAYIDELLPDVLNGTIHSGRVFDRVIGLEEVPDGYRAMNDREAIKVMVKPEATQTTHMSCSSVTFEPGARSAWHTHPLGQVLIVTAGTGWIQSWGGPIQEMRRGDIVRIAPGVKHWHGASAKSPMTHTALPEEMDTKNVEWLEKVSDAQYGPGPSTTQEAKKPKQQRT